MTAGMTTQQLDRRVSLPRAGLGALLAATLLMGVLIGTAIGAGAGAAITQRGVVGATLPRESSAVRELRIAAGRGQLIGESDPATVNPVIPTTLVITHAPGHGPLR